MGQYLIDTNIISKYLSDILPKNGTIFMDSVIDATPMLSIITEIELLCWKVDNVTQRKIENFLSDSQIFNITPEVVSFCVRIRKGKKIKTPDAIIAATALTHNLVLISHNVADFKHIQGLKVINPYDV